MKKWIGVLLVVFLLCAAIPLIGCAEDEASAEPYKVGAIFSATGFNQPLGEPEWQTVQMMVKQINDAGGINGHPLEVILRDDESSADKTFTLAEQLINEDKVLAIFGPTSTGSGMKIKPLVTEKEIPLISCAAGSVQVRPVEDARWVFTTPQLDVDVIDKVYEYMVDEGITRIALISDTAGFGKAGKTLLEAMAGSYGINIVANQTYGPYDSDMMTQLQLIKDANPQAVICWGTSPGPAIVARNMVTLGMKDNDAATPDAIPLFCSHGIAFASFMDVAGDAANGVIFLAGKLPIVDDLPDSDPQKALLMQYKTDFDAKYGSGRANTFGGHAYDALTIVVAALESLDEDPETISASADATKAARASIRDYIEQNVTNFSGTGGIFNISASDHNGLIKEDLVWIQIVDRKWTWFQ